MKKLFPILLCLMVLTLTWTPSSTEAAKGYTYTRYPIVLVGGIFDYDNLAFVDYFYGVDWAITKDAWNGSWWNKRQPVNYIMLSPLQNTRERGLDLAEQLEVLMAKLNVEKVNLIAHSHGATTSRVAMKLLAEKAETEGTPNPIASLTTIAGPHYGTATADASTLPFWPEALLDFVYDILNGIGNILSMIVHVSYETFFPPESPAAHPEDYIGEQDMRSVAADFTQQGMETFNSDFPCAGVWQNGTFGRGPNNESPQYGADATQGALAGNGRGEARPVSNLESTLYYSWTGDVENPVTSVDLMDVSMIATWLLSELYINFGHITTVEEITGSDVYNFVTFILTAPQYFLNSNLEIPNGIATDAFIPVTSARFGNVVSAPYPWNHVDEQNQTMGLVGGTINPLQVFRNHANRLYCAGR